MREFRELASGADAAEGRVLLDGAHLVHDARAARLPFDIVVVAESHVDAASEEGALARALDAEGADVVAAGDRLFAALSPVKSPGGIVAIARRAPVTAADICAAPGAFIVVAVDVQDPGNVGSLVRAAEAGGATGALISGVSANPFSWKALRGSMGSALRLPTAVERSPFEAVTMLRNAHVKTVASVARMGDDPDDIDWRDGAAVIVGGEGSGLPDELVRTCDARTTIPMAPGVESLNVAVATGILVYAARRQRTSRP